MNERAISLQEDQRLEQGLKKTLPLLHGIKAILDDRRERALPDTEDIKEFRSTIFSLYSHLSNPPLTPQTTLSACLEPWPIVKFGTTPSHDHSTGSTGQKRLLPPSPESKQRQKKSH